VAAELETVVGEGFLLVHWQDLNRDLFAALELQQLALFLVLGLIVVVSTFNVSSTLMVLVRERMRELGLLSALGFPRQKTVTVFLLYGAFVGGVGTAAGVLLGSAISWVITTFELIRFDREVAEIYFLSSVPFRVIPADLLAVVVFALGVTMISCLVPAWRAGRLEPAPALRYE
jgi:lipoprotein-releasing system permease protein